MGKEKLVEFLNKKLKDAKEKLEEISKEIAFINVAIEAVKEKKTKKSSPKAAMEEYFSYHFCPDQYVGVIKEFQEKNEKEDKTEVKKYFPIRENIFKDQTENVEKDFSSCNPIMILILESPHADEFDKNGEPIGPAVGETGTNIRTYIQKIFKDTFGSIEQYHLILMNVIPYQCSLGVDTEYFRTSVFKKMWNDKNIGSKLFFENRLKNLRGKLGAENVFIVNACTSMNGFKANIQESIKNITGKYELQLMHPCVNWRTKTNEQKEAVRKFIAQIKAPKK